MKGNKKYTEIQLIEACADVKNGMSRRQAAIKHGVPRTTLFDALAGKYTFGKHRPGPAAYLAPRQELRLKEHLLHTCRIGYEYQKKDIPDLVRQLLDEEEEQKFKKNNTPSLHWAQQFFARYPELSSSKWQFFDWFKGLENFLSDMHGIDVKEILSEKNSSRIFYVDKLDFPFSNTNEIIKIASTRSTKNSSREQITVICCSSASGALSKPYILLPGVEPYITLENEDKELYDLGFNPNGWMSGDRFYHWIVDLFYASIKEKDVKFPIIILLNRHTLYMNIAVANFCRDHDIILYCLPHHACHIMEPVESDIFDTLKRTCNTAFEEFKFRHKDHKINESNFISVFGNCWTSSLQQTSQSAIAGFRNSGLIPFNHFSIDFSELIEKELTATKIEKQASAIQLHHLEKVAIARCFKVIEEQMDESLLTDFKTRFKKGIDIVDSTAEGQLWRIYKNIRNIKEESQPLPNIFEPLLDPTRILSPVNSTSQIEPFNLPVSTEERHATSPSPIVITPDLSYLNEEMLDQRLTSVISHYTQGMTTSFPEQFQTSSQSSFENLPGSSKIKKEQTSRMYQSDFKTKFENIENQKRPREETSPTKDETELKRCRSLAVALGLISEENVNEVRSNNVAS